MRSWGRSPLVLHDYWNYSLSCSPAMMTSRFKRFRTRSEVENTEATQLFHKSNWPEASLLQTALSIASFSHRLRKIRHRWTIHDGDSLCSFESNLTTEACKNRTRAKENYYPRLARTNERVSWTRRNTREEGSGGVRREQARPIRQLSPTEMNTVELAGSGAGLHAGAEIEAIGDAATVGEEVAPNRPEAAPSRGFREVFPGKRRHGKNSPLERSWSEGDERVFALFVFLALRLLKESR